MKGGFRLFAPEGEAIRQTPAANQGHPYAQVMLAEMLEAGERGPADTSSAAKYYELAANHGMRAQYRLGLLLSSDRSEQMNLVSAYKWLVLAQNSVKEGATKAQELRKLLSPQQVADAEREIDSNGA